jgi:hypothetical protein
MAWPSPGRSAPRRDEWAAVGYSRIDDSKIDLGWGPQVSIRSIVNWLVEVPQSDHRYSALRPMNQFAAGAAIARQPLA